MCPCLLALVSQLNRKAKAESRERGFTQVTTLGRSADKEGPRVRLGFKGQECIKGMAGQGVEQSAIDPQCLDFSLS